MDEKSRSPEDVDDIKEYPAPQHIQQKIMPDRRHSTPYGQSAGVSGGEAKLHAARDPDGAVGGQAESFSDLKPLAYLNIKELELLKKLKAERENNDWVADIRWNHHAFRSLVVALFYRPNIPLAYRLFQRIPNLVGLHDIDLAIMRSECEIVMYKDLMKKKDHIESTLNNLRKVVTSLEPKFEPSDVNDWDELMKVKGRYLGRILLHYAAYCRYTSMSSSFYRTVMFDNVKIDIKMRSIHSCLAKISEIFLEIEVSTIRNVVAGVVAEIADIMADQAKYVASFLDYKTRPYLQSLCCNYLAWISLNTGKDKKCLDACDKGLYYLELYGLQLSHTQMLRADLLANKAIALVNLKDPKKAKEAKKLYHQARSIYKKLEDDKGMLKELENAKLFS